MGGDGPRRAHGADGKHASTHYCFCAAQTADAPVDLWGQCTNTLLVAPVTVR
jgi:hypothetical protein